MNLLKDDLTLLHVEFDRLREGQYEVWREVLAREALERSVTMQMPMGIEHMLKAAFCSGFDVGVMAARVGRN